MSCIKDLKMTDKVTDDDTICRFNMVCSVQVAEESMQLESQIKGVLVPQS